MYKKISYVYICTVCMGLEIGPAPRTRAVEVMDVMDVMHFV